MAIRITPSNVTSQSRWPVNGSVAAWPICSVADLEPPCVPPAASPSAVGVPASACGGFCSPVVVVEGVVVTLVAVVTVGNPGSGDGVGPDIGPGVGLGPGVGPGSGCGCGVGSPPQPPERRLFSACTSTSWPPEQGAALCGWLLPGPCSDVLPAAPFFSAICPAV